MARPKGKVEKRKTSIYASKKVDVCWGVIAGFTSNRDLTACIEYAMVEISRQIIKKEGIEDKYPQLK